MEEEGVAPFVGAWIEILLMFFSSILCMSLPSWERGLKYLRHMYTDEMCLRRSLRGSVD